MASVQSVASQKVSKHRRLFLILNALALPGLILFIWVGIQSSLCTAQYGASSCGDVGMIFLFPPFTLALFAMFVVGFVDFVALCIMLIRNRAQAIAAERGLDTDSGMLLSVKRIMWLLIGAAILIFVVAKLMYVI